MGIRHRCPCNIFFSHFVSNKTMSLFKNISSSSLLITVVLLAAIYVTELWFHEIPMATIKVPNKPAFGVPYTDDIGKQFPDAEIDEKTYQPSNWFQSQPIKVDGTDTVVCIRQFGKELYCAGSQFLDNYYYVMFLLHFFTLAMVMVIALRHVNHRSEWYKVLLIYLVLLLGIDSRHLKFGTIHSIIIHSQYYFDAARVIFGK